MAIRTALGAFGGVDYIGQLLPSGPDHGGPARKTSSTTTIVGVSDRTDRPTGRCVDRTPLQGVGTREDAAVRDVDDTCDVSPTQ